MEARTGHFTGETVVWRGPWHMEIPLDFHMILNPEVPGADMKTAAMVISKFLSEEFVLDAEGCMMEDEDVDES